MISAWCHCLQVAGETSSESDEPNYVSFLAHAAAGATKCGAFFFFLPSLQTHWITLPGSSQPALDTHLWTFIAWTYRYGHITLLFMTSHYHICLSVFVLQVHKCTPATPHAHFTQWRPHEGRPSARCVSQQVASPRISEPVAWHHVSCSGPLTASCFSCPSSPSRLFCFICVMFFFFFFCPQEITRIQKDTPFFCLPLTHSSCSGVALEDSSL